MNYTLTTTPVFALANLNCLKLKRGHTKLYSRVGIEGNEQIGKVIRGEVVYFKTKTSSFYSGIKKLFIGAQLFWLERETTSKRKWKSSFLSGGNFSSFYVSVNL